MTKTLDDVVNTLAAARIELDRMQYVYFVCDQMNEDRFFCERDSPFETRIQDVPKHIRAKLIRYAMWMLIIHERTGRDSTVLLKALKELRR